MLPFGTEDIRRIAVGESTSGDKTILAAQTGKKIRVVAVFLKVEGAVTLQFKSGSTNMGGAIPWDADDAYVEPFNPAGWMETASGEALLLNLSASVDVNGHVVCLVGE